MNIHSPQTRVLRRLSRGVLILCVLALLVLAVPGVQAGVDSGSTQSDKMHFPQYPDPNGWDVNATCPMILADDFECTATGPITNVVFWGSWQDDLIGLIADIHLSFHDDDRTGPFSKPGVLLWEWDTAIFEMEEVEPPSPQGWFDPSTGMAVHPNHHRYFRFDVPIPEGIAFIQQQGTIYWLDLQFTVDRGTFGVKTSLDHFEDRAVWGDTIIPGFSWQELLDPDTGGPLDLAFIIQGKDDEMDFGDAPDPTYPTLLASDGARHPILQGFHLGPNIDAEPDGQPDATATGDDLANIDDEDGVTFTTVLLPGQQACVDVNLTNTAGVGAPSLDAWIDFDASGTWDDPAEHLWGGASQPLLSGSNVLCFQVPPNASRGPTFARFRLGDARAIPPFGLGPLGEVEDYQVYIEATKWEQPPTFNLESQYPECYWGWDEVSIYNDDINHIVADDWECKDNRPITDIHWWGSYVGWYDIDPPIEPPPSGIAPDSFHIGIWTDVPLPNPVGFSHPDKMVWDWVVPRAELNGQHDGCDFHDVMPSPDSCFKYDFEIRDKDDWFYQEPGEEPRVYWISISAIYSAGPPMEHLWGWKTRRPEWNDDAVRIEFPLEPHRFDSYAHGSPIETEEGSWDMAFILTTSAEPKAPDVDIAIAASGTDVELSWQHVTTDIYGYNVTVVKYYIYRDTAPYQGAAAPLVDTVTGSGLITWIDPGPPANTIGDPTFNYYYYVQAVAQDASLNDVTSALSNHVGEFDFGIVPGS